ncbi:transcription termination/antitermination protein NusG [Litorimonas cladophorae]|uniref:Transcription termination/antitermination protein NusG n=1 Tax=Litorimonas cladophorae TaxID=1220491 RepID=A0A918KTL4_9PROT|nr:transcription termination/antitermination protein NusG [Litorimonas cladophorae]GGX75837.1 transcription termination/antitermination protein NusG [Litorimonas cladophorae]
MAAKWYIVQAYSNFEKRVKETLERDAAEKGLDHLFEEILVPTETVVEVRKGRKMESERKFFPGYVLVKVDLTDEAYHLVKNTPKVTGFLGSTTKPMPVSEKEVERIVGQIQEGVDSPRPMISFDIGEIVKVVDGPFQSFNGTVESVDEESARLKVLINIFGQGTPVELNYTQVEKS